MRMSTKMLRRCAMAAIVIASAAGFTSSANLTIQAGAYQNSTWVVAVAKGGAEDGYPMIAGSLIVNPDGEIVAEAKTEDDELIVADCDLDATRFAKATIFDFDPTISMMICASVRTSSMRSKSMVMLNCLQGKPR